MGYRIGVMGQFLKKKIQKDYGCTDGMSDFVILELLIAAKKIEIQAGTKVLYRMLKVQSLGFISEQNNTFVFEC